MIYTIQCCIYWQVSFFKHWHKTTNLSFKFISCRIYLTTEELEINPANIIFAASWCIKAGWCVLLYLTLMPPALLHICKLLMKCLWRTAWRKEKFATHSRLLQMTDLFYFSFVRLKTAKTALYLVFTNSLA